MHSSQNHFSYPSILLFTRLLLVHSAADHSSSSYEIPYCNNRRTPNPNRSRRSHISSKSNQKCRFLLYKPLPSAVPAPLPSETGARSPLPPIEVVSVYETPPTRINAMYGLFLPRRPHRRDIAAPRTNPSTQCSTHFPSRLYSINPPDFCHSNKWRCDSGSNATISHVFHCRSTNKSIHEPISRFPWKYEQQLHTNPAVSLCFHRFPPKLPCSSLRNVDFHKSRRFWEFPK